MRNTLILLFVLAITAMAGQTAFAQTKEASDPKAKVVLDRVKAKYHSYKQVQADFKLMIELGDQKENKTGKIWLSGDKYKVESKDQDIYCNGQRIWIHLKTSAEVQVNNVGKEDDNILSPAALFRIYESDKKYIFALIGDSDEGGKSVTHVEFKPVNRASEYSKVRISIDKATDLLSRVVVFSKDGVRYTFDIIKTNPNSAADNSIFVFDPSKFPNVRITDLSR